VRSLRRSESAGILWKAIWSEDVAAPRIWTFIDLATRREVAGRWPAASGDRVLQRLQTRCAPVVAFCQQRCRDRL
jgi:hypothetical protein